MNVKKKLIEDLVLKACQEEECRLYLMDLSSTKLQVYVDKKGQGVDLSSLEKLSKRISLFLMKENWGATLELEVSSPGANRKLKHPWHFKEVIGKEIQVETFSPLQNQKVFKGCLKKAGDSSIEIEYDSNLLKLELSNIKKSRLIFKILKNEKKFKSQKKTYAKTGGDPCYQI